MPPQTNAKEDDNLLNIGEELLDSSTQTKQHFEVKWFSDWEGYGCVASQDIERYTLIHIEEPFMKGEEISNALRLHNSQLKSQRDDTEYLNHVCGKSDENIERLWQLHDQYQHKYEDRYNSYTKRLWGIILSNSFENHEKNYHKRLYLTTSRFNHSCSPNVTYDVVGWTIRLYTMRDIKAGETLCISYSDVMYHFPSNVRRSYLIGAMNFDCACTVCDCSIDPTARMRSDDNRRRLKQIAIELKHRVNATLYSSEFCLHVHEIANRGSGEQSKVVKEVASEADKLRRRAELVEKAKLRKLSKAIPIGQRDIALISEYINLLEEERIDSNMLPIYKLAYHVTLKTGTSNPPKEYWVEKYLDLVRCAKGFSETEALVSLQCYQIDEENQPPW